MTASNQVRSYLLSVTDTNEREDISIALDLRLSVYAARYTSKAMRKRSLKRFWRSVASLDFSANPSENLNGYQASTTHWPEFVEWLLGAAGDSGAVVRFCHLGKKELAANDFSKLPTV
jgi:hypothetical protein